ncbi:WXG100 family type VII secretion target [Bacillus cereus]|nr:WXG100 family type VII secretion target [Bacillus cereus BAG3X2-1]PEA20279.1 WXG100 family type VII secretion target [Bacillus cereus]PET95020.1 WXG100 family type VII secretion target [Bacillus cereus]PFB97090.1 WXG100 family type VII secretion target [Bacillus cereus]PFE66907.1 WXG100 family type VII secretion target [Bacillus cereus]
MGDIKVTPEQLRKVAGTIRSTITNATATQERLKRDIDMISSNWLGSTYMKFNTDFCDSSFKMAQFITILEPLEKFLLDSANKFEQVDNMDVAIAMASGILNKNNDKVEYLTGSSEVVNGNRVGGKLEGTLLNTTTDIGKGTTINNKLMTANLEANFGLDTKTIKEDITTGGLFGFKAEASNLESNIEKKDFIGENTTLTSKYQNFNLALGIDEYTFKAEAGYTAHKYEALFEKVDIPDIIPYFRDNDFTMRFELGAGNFGFKVHAGAENGFYTPVYKDFAVGFFVKREEKE